MKSRFDSYPTIYYDSEIPEVHDHEELRAVRKWECALGYRILGAMGWGQTGAGHITARDPILTDHFWVLGFGVPFSGAKMADLILMSPDGDVIEGPPGLAVNHAAYFIHHPILAARPDVASAVHCHTPFGTPWSTHVEPFRALSQESCAFVFDQAVYEGEDLEVVDTAGGARIAAAMGDSKLCILRNHGLLTAGASPGIAVGWFVLAEQVAEVHIKAPAGKAISGSAARDVADALAEPLVGWRTFQWLARNLVPDPSVVC